MPLLRLELSGAVIMQYNILNRFTGEIQITAEIECAANTPPSLKLGLAVKWALREKKNLRSADLSSANLSYADLISANLSYADLISADLRYANLRYANLSYANLSSANLRYADLSSANLRTFKADLWMVLTQNRNEVAGLVSALREGRVDGSVYEGECACLKGTLANVRGVNVSEFDQDVSQPAEQWFLMIKKGDKPTDETGGGFAAKMALGWALEWCAANGIEVAA
jgi:uncharacterized protein YjbI with pentapeptide repeats